MTNLDVTSDANFTDNLPTISDVPLNPVNNIVNPNQIRSGVTRGSQIILGADGFPQILSGNQPTFGNGFFVAKHGVDVTSSSDPSSFIFNSSQDIFKIVGSGTYTDAVSHTTSTPSAGQFTGDTFSIATIPHDLGYVPAIIGYLGLSNGGYQPIPYTDYLSFTGTIALWFTWSITVDPTNVNIRLNTLAYGSSSGIGAGTKFKYFLLQESAN